jgi:hypothetical protein
MEWRVFGITCVEVDMTMRRLRSIVIDCARPAALARFWADVLGYTVRPYDEAALARLRAAGIDDIAADPSVAILPQDDGPTLWFNLVPEPKVAKNRVHIDVNLENLAQLDHLVGLGARILRPLGAVPNEPWVILADPEGNEFCAFPPRPEP